MTRDLLALREWLGSVGVTQVGMEATGVYWKSVHVAFDGPGGTYVRREVVLPLR